MTADFALIPWDILQKISVRIINEVRDVTPIVYDVTSKPPFTNGKSNSLDVQDGDSIEISHSSLNLWFFLALFIFGLVLQTLDVSFFLGTLPIAIVFYIIIYKTVRLIRLEKASTTSRQ
jgi:hypothetical protein